MGVTFCPTRGRVTRESRGFAASDARSTPATQLAKVGIPLLAVDPLPCTSRLSTS